MAWVYDPKTNRYVNTTEASIPKGTDVTAGDGQPWEWSDIPQNQRTTTTTQPKQTTTTQPKQSPTTTVAPTTTKPNTQKPTSRSTRARGSGGPTPEQISKGYYVGGPNFKTQGTAAIETAIQDILGSDSSTDALLKMFLGGSSGGGGGAPAGPTRAQRISAAKRAGRQATSAANKFFSQQQTQANDAIRNATLEFLANIPKSTAYQDVPLLSMSPEVQGLQENLLAYGGTGELAAGQRAEDAQTASMYEQLARRGATQMGNAEQAYLDALRRAAQGGQTAGLSGVAQNIAALQNEIQMRNLQALLEARTQ